MSMTEDFTNDSWTVRVKITELIYLDRAITEEEMIEYSRDSREPYTWRDWLRDKLDLIRGWFRTTTTKL